MAFSVSGARWRKSAIFASPLPRTEATHSTLETEPAVGSETPDKLALQQTSP
jgi:hypothetical protein